MSMPVVPERTQLEALTDLLESIALEETALAHLVNAESEKLQAIAALLANGHISAEQANCFQKTVEKLLQTAIKMQMLLEFKLDSVLAAKLKLEIGPVVSPDAADVV